MIHDRIKVVDGQVIYSDDVQTFVVGEYNGTSDDIKEILDEINNLNHESRR